MMVDREICGQMSLQWLQMQAKGSQASCWKIQQNSAGCKRGSCRRSMTLREAPGLWEPFLCQGYSQMRRMFVKHHDTLARARLVG